MRTCAMCKSMDVGVLESRACVAGKDKHNASTAVNYMYRLRKCRRCGASMRTVELPFALAEELLGGIYIRYNEDIHEMKRERDSGGEE